MEQLQSAGFARKFQEKALKWSGFNAAEEFVRSVNLIAAKSMLRDAIRANQKNPMSAKSLRYRGFFARLGIRSPQSLIDEGGAGPLTDQFLRAAVNEVQGGYRYDQVPAFMDTPQGRFLLQYQKWGAQQLRHFARNVANPAVQAISLGRLGNKEFVKVRDPKTGNVATRQVPGNLMPAARYLFVLTAVGAGLSEILKLLFGRADQTATLAEIMSSMQKGDGYALGMILNKLFSYHLLVGSAGLLGNYAQFGMDFASRSRFKNPFDPPALGPAQAVGNFVLDGIEQGQITGNDVKQLANSIFTGSRDITAIGARGLTSIGVEPRWARSEMRRQDMSWLRGITRRYNDQIGVQQNRTSFQRIGKNPNTPTFDAIKQGLLLGDAHGARETIREWMRGKSEDRQKLDMAALMASVRASQPIRAGYGSEAMRVNFLSWAREHLDPSDVLRVKEIDQTYRRTAIGLGLMNPEKDISDEDLNDAIRRIQVKTR